MGWIAQLVDHLYVNSEVIGSCLAAVNFSFFKLKQLKYFRTCWKIAILFVIRAFEVWTQYKHHLVLETYPLLIKQNTWDESTVYSTKSPMLLKKTCCLLCCMLKNCHYCGFALLPACHPCNPWAVCVCVCEAPISPSSAKLILLQQRYIPAISTSAPWQSFMRGILGFMACAC